MRGIKYLVIVATAASLVAGTGCKNKEEGAAPSAQTGQAVAKKELSHVVEQTPITGNKEETIAVPDSVKGKWKDVKIEVLNKQTNKKTTLVIPIGGEASIPDSALKIKAENFLPDFSMSGENITSASNEPKNPAAQIVVMDDGKEIFRGWLFALYSSAQFEHPNHSLTLVGYTPQ